MKKLVICASVFGMVSLLFCSLPEPYCSVRLLPFNMQSMYSNSVYMEELFYEFIAYPV
jgi:hypothetical protein